LDLNIFEKEKFSGKYIITLEYKFNGLQKFEFIYYLNEEILNLNNKKVTDEDIKIICNILGEVKYTKIKKIYLEENSITEEGFDYLLQFLSDFNDILEEMKIKNIKIDINIMQIDSIILNQNKICKLEKNKIENLFLKCKYIKWISLSKNPFNKDNKQETEFYNFFN